MEDAEKGEIYIAGQQVNQVKASKRGVGFVFQNYALFRYKTVYDNIAFGLKIAKWKKADIKERVEELIDLVGLRGMEKRYPNQLSAGVRNPGKRGTNHCIPPIWAGIGGSGRRSKCIYSATLCH